MIKFIAGYEIEGVEKGTINGLKDWLIDREEATIDIETSAVENIKEYNEEVYKGGLDPYLSRICMLQIGNDKEIFVIDVRDFSKEEIKSIFDVNPMILWSGSNLKFEAKHLKHNYGVRLGHIWDCMLVDMSLSNGLQLGYSLEKMAARYLGTKSSTEVDLFTDYDPDEAYIDKSTRLGFIHIGNTKFTKEQVLYGAGDIEYPFRIKQFQMQGREGYNPQKLHDLENEFCLVLADMELKGITFDKEQWLEVEKTKQAEFKHRLDKLNKYIEQNYPQFCTSPDLFSPGRICNIQWSSSKQVIEVFKASGGCPKEKSKETGKVEYTVGAKALTKLLTAPYKELFMKDKETEIISREDFILNYLLLKKSEQSITTFGAAFLKYVHPITGRLHSSYRQLMATGRISSNNPNLQNVPHDLEYRKCFTAQKGNTLINCDFSSSESRILADVSEDPTMIKFFNEGHPIHLDDFHSFTATATFRILRNDPTLILNKKDNPEERTIAKTLSFALAYGASSFSLKDNLGVEVEVAEEFMDAFFDSFPTLRDTFEDAKKKAVKNGFIIMDPFIDRRWFDKNFSKMNDLSKQAWSFYPENYKDLSSEEKIDIKSKIYKEHPELKKIWSEYFYLQGKLSRRALNYPIQSRNASQMKLAMCLFRRYLIANDLQDSISLTSIVHDEALAESIIEKSKLTRELVEKFMIEGANTYTSNVKMDAEAVITPYWHH